MTEEKKHQHRLVVGSLKDEIFDERSVRYIIVEYICMNEDGEMCPDQVTENRVLKVDSA